jgi:hypothetical protein
MFNWIKRLFRPVEDEKVERSPFSKEFDEACVEFKTYRNNVVLPRLAEMEREEKNRPH